MPEALFVAYLTGVFLVTVGMTARDIRHETEPYFLVIWSFMCGIAWPVMLLAGIVVLLARGIDEMKRKVWK